MDSRAANEWQQTLAGTQEYLHQRIFGSGCERETIEAWRCFYQTHDPIVRTMIMQWGLPASRAERCLEEIWLDILTEVPKLRLPLSHDAFLYWLSQLTRAKVNWLREQGERNSQPPGNGNWLARGRESPELVRSPDSPLPETAEVILPDLALTNARVFQLRVVEERSPDDVAQTLGITRDQVEVRRRSMLQRILSILIKMDARTAWSTAHTVSGGE